MHGDPVVPPSDGVFTVARRGYDPQQVDAHLRRLDAEIRILAADRDAAVDQASQLGRELDEARLRADRLRTQVRTMAGRPSDVQGMSERMRTMLRLAEDEVADMLRRADAEVERRIGDADRTAAQAVGRAHGEAAEILTAARAQAEATAAEAARLRADTDAACAADRRAVALERRAAEEALAKATEEAERERALAWSESERRRTTVEEDFDIAMDQRRAEALAHIQAEHVRVEQWAERTREDVTRRTRAELAAAEETARTIVAEAQERVAQLADLRGRIAAQLRGTQAQLDAALAALAHDIPREAPAAVDGHRPAPVPDVVPPPVAPEPVAPEPVAPEPVAQVAGPPAVEVGAPPAAPPAPAATPTTAPPVAAPASSTARSAPGPARPDVSDRDVPGDFVPDQRVAALAAPEQAGAEQPGLSAAEARRPAPRRRKRRPAAGATRR